MSYYNTTGAAGDQLDAFERKAATQEAKILLYFDRHPRVKARPTDVLHAVWPFPLTPPPLTSVRRAMSDLTEAGKLRIADQAAGEYGRPVHRWTRALP